MKKIVGYLKTYVRSLSPLAFFSCTVFLAIAVFWNYSIGVNDYLNSLSFPAQFSGWYAIFLIVFFFGYLAQYQRRWHELFQNRIFLTLLLLAPALFAWKMAAQFHFNFSADVYQNAYWHRVVYWPLKLVVVTALLLLIWKCYNPEQPFYGTATKAFDAQPYFLLLFLMLPLLLVAATQPDFLAIYPKLKNIAFLDDGTWWHKLLYELSYGSDFFTIELFFRGFLILAFARWAGHKAVLPMALFYCTIHFGKPLGECISSYFGGLILGVITLHTRAIWGGLIVHLGIAWLMELFGYLGHLWLM
jgi:hypothetical protein